MLCPRASTPMPTLALPLRSANTRVDDATPNQAQHRPGGAVLVGEQQAHGLIREAARVPRGSGPRESRTVIPEARRPSRREAQAGLAPGSLELEADRALVGGGPGAPNRSVRRPAAGTAGPRSRRPRCRGDRGGQTRSPARWPSRAGARRSPPFPSRAAGAAGFPGPAPRCGWTGLAPARASAGAMVRPARPA